jgi:hypothetical protein
MVCIAIECRWAQSPTVYSPFHCGHNEFSSFAQEGVKLLLDFTVPIFDVAITCFQWGYLG